MDRHRFFTDGARSVPPSEFSCPSEWNAPRPIRELRRLSLQHGVHRTGDVHHTAPHCHTKPAKSPAVTRPAQAVTACHVEQRTVRGTDDGILVGRQEPVCRPVQWMPGMRTAILVSEHGLAAAHDKSPERPVTLADPELAAARIVDRGQRSKLDFSHRLNYCHRRQPADRDVWQRTWPAGSPARPAPLRTGKTLATRSTPVRCRNNPREIWEIAP